MARQRQESPDRRHIVGGELTLESAPDRRLEIVSAKGKNHHIRSELQSTAEIKRVCLARNAMPPAPVW